ncbi:hypothetical protein ACHAXT_002992 [Thalassiosira profunda]
MLLFTTKRAIFVDMQGLFGIGKKVEYVSLPWTTVTAFSVRSAGSFADKDSELCLWLDFDDVFNPMRANEDDPPPPPIPRRSFLEIDFQKNQVDIMVVHRYLSERLMRVKGHEMKPYTSLVSQDLLRPSGGKNPLDWIGDNAVAIDPEAVNEKFHASGVLQHDETVAFAFKTGRDSLYLTNKRLLVIDVQGFTGKRKEIQSVPWDTVVSWSVESAGSFDRDMELRVYFKGFWKSKVKQDLRKGKADIFAIQSFIAHFILGKADGRTALANAQSYQPSKSGAGSKLLGFLGDAHTKDPSEITEKLRSSPALLQEDESIDAAFKCGRDLFLISTKRIIIVDKKGITGKSVEYKSYPLMYNKAFHIETEGHLLNGPEVKVYTHHGDIKQELAKGHNDDVWGISEILSEKLLNNIPKEIGEVEIGLNGTGAAPAGQLTFPVQLPPNMGPGAQIQVPHPQSGQMLVVTVPNGVAPGGVFNVAV